MYVLDPFLMSLALTCDVSKVQKKWSKIKKGQEWCSCENKN